MTPLLRRTATIGTATLGLSLALAGAVPAVSAETTDAAAPAAATSAAPTPSNSGGDKYELAAAYSGLSADEVRSQELSGAIKVSDNGFILNVDGVTTTGPSDTSDLQSFAGQLDAAAIPGSAAGGSRPGAPVTVYLDFDGETLEGTSWNDLVGSSSLAFSPAASANDGFKSAVWAVVAEDYAPFNVNVTTTNPGTDKLVKSSADDNEFGSHVIITDSYDELVPEAINTSGLAWRGGTGSDYLTGALVFTEGLGGAAAGTKDVGNTAAHESAHNFGLTHDGIAGSTTGEYYVPTGGLWAPTMGGSFNVPISQWSNGSYAGATNPQADLDVITDRSTAGVFLAKATTPDGQIYTDAVCVISGDPDAPKPGDQWFVPTASNTCEGNLVPLTLTFSYTDRADFAADDAGNTAAESTTLENNGTFTTTGVIGNTGDVDVYGVIAAGGPFTATVSVADIAPDLDAKLTLTDSQGNVIAENDPAATRLSADTAGGLGATITVPNVATGAYYLSVDGVGTGDPATATPADSNGYTDYASLGNYTLSGTAVAFVAEELVIETPVEGAKVVGGSTVAVTGTATPNVTVTLTVGGTNVTTVADADGKWTASITANAFGNTNIVATQGFANLAVPGTDSVTVTAPVSAPVITSPANGSTTGSATPTVSGSGIAGATVTVSVVDASGNVTNGQALVKADGTWELVLGTPLPSGTYTIYAVQTINEVTSGLTAPVTFAIDLTVTTGDGNDPVKVDNTLAATGNDLLGSPFVLLAAGLLLAGAVTMSFAIRRRRALGQQG